MVPKLSRETSFVLTRRFGSVFRNYKAQFAHRLEDFLSADQFPGTVFVQSIVRSNIPRKEHFVNNTGSIVYHIISGL